MTTKPRTVVESAMQILIERAVRGESITYRDLIVELGESFSRPKVRWVCKLLADIDREGETRGEPPLAVLVVRSSDHLPGDGWWASRNRYVGPWEGANAVRYVRRLQNQTFRFWQSRQTNSH